MIAKGTPSWFGPSTALPVLIVWCNVVVWWCCTLQVHTTQLPDGSVSVTVPWPLDTEQVLLLGVHQSLIGVSAGLLWLWCM
jgi:hypothetical protein